ncbi:MAG TPA: S9 family peptidase [Candidatus Angelobacter sp.]|nr:S9 family peptidase [Candidatus Angelobacter sp.]
MRGSKFAVLIVLTLATVLAAVSQTAPSTAKHPFTFKDMMALKRIGSPSVSPDGKWVLFTAMDVNLDENKRTNHIWVVPIGGGDAKPLTSDPAAESGPRWSPDGKKFLFVSAKGGSQQVWVADFNPAIEDLNGSPIQITHISTDADGAIWSPDGKNIVFTSEVYPGCRDDLCNKTSEEAQAKSKVKAMIFTRLFYRHWNAYTRFKRNHLFVVPAEGGTAKDITPGDHDVPPFSLGGQDLYTVSPDGQEVAFTSNIDEVEATSTNNDIFVVPITGGEPKKLSTSPGGDSTPVYSPDGKWLAWRMQVRPGYESDRFRLVIYDRKAGQIHNLTENVDRWVEAMAWSPDSRTIYFTSEDKGEIPIYSLEIDKPNQVHELLRGANDELQVTGDGKTLVFSRMSVQAPNEIFKLAMGSKEPVQLTHLNDPVLSRIMMPPMESFWFTGDTGTKVQGFMIKPPNFNAQRKYPVKFLIHGGPQGQWGDEWSYRWNAELFAADGYVVIMINPRGSTGYGQQFIDGINGDWGGKPYVDLMKGLDYAEQKYPFIAKDRECALGASYGGYMIDWLLGHTNRFKCLVSHDGMFNTESAYGSTEELWFPEWEFKGTPWTNREGYRKWSPHEYASQFKTPTLVVHGQLDYRLDVSEGFQLFTTLQRLKIPSKMLYFPDEGHWVLKPQNSQLWYNTVNGWVQQWTQ